MFGRTKKSTGEKPTPAPDFSAPQITCEQSEKQNGNKYEQTLVGSKLGRDLSMSQDVSASCLQNSSLVESLQKPSAVCTTVGHKKFLGIGSGQKLGYETYAAGEGQCMTSKTAMVINASIERATFCLKDYVGHLPGLNSHFDLYNYLMSVAAKESGFNPTAFSYDHTAKMGILGITSAELDRAVDDRHEMLNKLTKDPSCDSIKSSLQGLNTSAALTESDSKKISAQAYEKSEDYRKGNAERKTQIKAIFQDTEKVAKEGAVCDLLNGSAESILKNLVVGISAFAHSVKNLSPALAKLSVNQQAEALLVARRVSATSMNSALANPPKLEGDAFSKWLQSKGNAGVQVELSQYDNAIKSVKSIEEGRCLHPTFLPLATSEEHAPKSTPKPTPATK